MLNLWQKNNVFKSEIIQPLLDMAAGTSATAPMAENATNNEGRNGILTSALKGQMAIACLLSAQSACS